MLSWLKKTEESGVLDIYVQQTFWGEIWDHLITIVKDKERKKAWLRVKIANAFSAWTYVPSWLSRTAWSTVVTICWHDKHNRPETNNRFIYLFYWSHTCTQEHFTRQFILALSREETGQIRGQLITICRLLKDLPTSWWGGSQHQSNNVSSWVGLELTTTTLVRGSWATGHVSQPHSPTEAQIHVQQWESTHDDVLFCTTVLLSQLIRPRSMKLEDALSHLGTQ